MKKDGLRILSTSLTVVTIIISIFYGKTLVDKIELNGLNIPYLFLSGTLFVVFYLTLSFNWFYITKIVDENVSKSQMLSFFASQPYKYLPTSLFTFSFRAKYSKDLGMNLKNSSFAQLVENIILISAGIITALMVFTITYVKFYTILIFFMGLIVYLLIPVKLQFKIKSYKKTIAKKQLLKSYSLVMLGWIICSLSFYLMNKSLGISLAVNTAIVSNSTAYVTGIFAFFAPGGIGVRELVYSFFSISAVAIVYWRLLTFVFDISLGFGAVYLISKKK